MRCWPRWPPGLGGWDCRSDPAEALVGSAGELVGFETETHRPGVLRAKIEVTDLPRRQQ